MAAKHSKLGWIDRNDPEAAARCDRGGEIRRKSELLKEYIYAGNALVWNGFLVCKHHMDRPHPVDKLLVLPPDPVPVKDPRIDIPNVPVPWYVNDGTPGQGDASGGYTAGYVTDSHNRPVISNNLDPRIIEVTPGVPSTDAQGNVETTSVIPPVPPPARFPWF